MFMNLGSELNLIPQDFHNGQKSLIMVANIFWYHIQVNILNALHKHI